MLIGVTDEEPAVVEAWLKRMKPTYPIAITRGAFERQINVPHFPYSAVIGPDGKIAFAGNAGMGEGALDEAMARSKKQPLWPKSLAKINKLMLGDSVKAYAELRKLVDGGKVAEEDRPHVETFVAYLEGQAQAALEEARGFRDKGFVFKALRRIEPYSNATPPFPATADGQALRKELEALPEYKKELSGGEAYLAAEALEGEKEYLEAFEGYKSVAKKFAGTRIAENARAQAERLRTDGLPGFAAACDGCRKGGRACDKHRKDVKL